jgi:hypothetical protein
VCLTFWSNYKETYFRTKSTELNVIKINIIENITDTLPVTLFYWRQMCLE